MQIKDGYKISEEYLISNADNLTADDWDWLSASKSFSKFSYKFIRDYEGEFNWFLISERKELNYDESKEFILEFKDKLNLSRIIEKQRSPSFFYKNCVFTNVNYVCDAVSSGKLEEVNKSFSYE